MKLSTSSIAASLCLSAYAHPNAARREALANRGDNLAFDLSDRSHHSRKGAVAPKHYQGFTQTTGGPGGYAGPSNFASGITEVTGTVVVPQVIAPPGAESGVTYGLAAWVGIQSGGGLFQTGMTATVNSSNIPTYGLFWEFVGNLPIQGFSDAFSFGAGDTLEMTVTVTGSNSGTAVVVNPATSQTASVTKTGLSGTIGSKSCNFVMEDYGVSGGSIPFAAWSGAFQWSDCSYISSAGQNNNPFSGSQPGNIAINGNNLTAFTILSESSYSISYVGTSADTAME